MSSKQQVVTIQIGKKANYLGTHLWNVRYNNVCENDTTDVLFREHIFRGMTQQIQPSWVPRLCIVDVPSSFGALSSDDCTIRKARTTSTTTTETSSSLWSNGAQQVYEQEKIKPHRYQYDIDDDDDDDDDEIFRNGDVKYWSDFMKFPLHPHSAHIIQTACDDYEEEDDDDDDDYNKNNNEMNDFDLFSTSQSNSTNSLFVHDDIYDNGLRQEFEACDSLGGVILCTSSYGAYAGITTTLHEILSDVVASGSMLPRLTFSVNNDNRKIDARLITSCFEHQSQYTPITSTKTSDYFNTFADSALSIDTALYPLLKGYTFRGNQGRLLNVGQYTSLFTHFGTHHNHQYLSNTMMIRMKDMSHNNNTKTFHFMNNNSMTLSSFTSRGFHMDRDPIIPSLSPSNTTTQLLLSLDNPVIIPYPFPNNRLYLQKQQQRYAKLISGFTCDTPTTIENLTNLYHSLPSQRRQMRLQPSEMEELCEILKSHIDDLE